MKEPSRFAERLARRFRKRQLPSDLRLVEDRRWCSERRIEQRRDMQITVIRERRLSDRRTRGRRSGLDRRRAA